MCGDGGDSLPLCLCPSVHPAGGTVPCHSTPPLKGLTTSQSHYHGDLASRTCMLGYKSYPNLSKQPSGPDLENSRLSLHPSRLSWELGQVFWVEGTAHMKD